MIRLYAGKSRQQWLGLLLCVLTFNHSVLAGIGSQSPGDSQVIQQDNIGEVLRAKKLDQLFVSLQVASTEQDARRIESAIWRQWFSSDNRAINQKMQAIMAAREAGDYENAIILLNDLIAQYPGFSEGWNQRATIYYLMGNFDASVLDVAQTLQLEPRHFGALSGLAIILWQQGNQDLARKSLREAIRIHPFLRGQDMFDQ